MSTSVHAPVSAAAAARRENARNKDGKFGEQNRAEADDFDPAVFQDTFKATADHPLIVEALAREDVDVSDLSPNAAVAVNAMFWWCKSDDDVRDRLEEYEGWEDDPEGLHKVAEDIQSWSTVADTAEPGDISVSFLANGEGRFDNYYETSISVSGVSFRGHCEEVSSIHGGLRGAVDFGEAIVSDVADLRSNLDKKLPYWRGLQN